MLRALRVHAEFAAAPEPFLHPGRAARVRIGGEDVGWLGEIHPQVAAEWDIEEPVAGFEIDLDCVIAAAPRELPYADMTSFPAVRQDLAVVVAAGVTADVVIAVVRDAGGALLRSAEIFDVYRGEQVGEGRTSLALRLEFRAGERTLTDEDVAPRRAKIVKALTDKLGAELRG